MTDAERRAVRLLGEAWNAVLDAIPDAQSRAEACTDIHRLQNLVLAQATIRAEPGWLRQATPTAPVCVNHSDRPSRANLDSEELCQECANTWVRGEGAHAAWLEAEESERKAP